MLKRTLNRGFRAVYLALGFFPLITFVTGFWGRNMVMPTVVCCFEMAFGYFIAFNGKKAVLKLFAAFATIGALVYFLCLEIPFGFLAAVPAFGCFIVSFFHGKLEMKNFFAFPRMLVYFAMYLGFFLYSYLDTTRMWFSTFLAALGTGFVIVSLFINCGTILTSASLSKYDTSKPPVSVRIGSYVFLGITIAVALLISTIGPLKTAFVSLFGLIAKGVNAILVFFDQLLPDPEGAPQGTVNPTDIQQAVGELGEGFGNAELFGKIAVIAGIVFISAFVLFLLFIVLRALVRMMSRAIVLQSSTEVAYEDHTESTRNNASGNPIKRFLEDISDRLRDPKAEYAKLDNNTARTRFLYRFALERVSRRNEDQYTALTPNEFSRDRSVRELLNLTSLDALAKAYNEARYAERSPSSELVNSAKSILEKKKK